MAKAYLETGGRVFSIEFIPGQLEGKPSSLTFRQESGPSITRQEAEQFADILGEAIVSVGAILVGKWNIIGLPEDPTP